MSLVGSGPIVPLHSLDVPACRVLTISEYSRQEIVERLGLAPDKVAAVDPAVRAKRFHPRLSSTQIEAANKEFGIHRPLFFTLATTSRRKICPR